MLSLGIFRRANAFFPFKIMLWPLEPLRPHANKPGWSWRTMGPDSSPAARHWMPWKAEASL